MHQRRSSRDEAVQSPRPGGVRDFRFRLGRRRWLRHRRRNRSAHHAQQVCPDNAGFWFPSGRRLVGDRGRGLVRGRELGHEARNLFFIRRIGDAVWGSRLARVLVDRRCLGVRFVGFRSKCRIGQLLLGDRHEPFELVELGLKVLIRLTILGCRVRRGVITGRHGHVGGAELAGQLGRQSIRLTEDFV